LDRIAKPKLEAQLHAVAVDATIKGRRGSTKALDGRTRPGVSPARGVIVEVPEVAASA
jgi:hypothetical protein